LSAVEAIAGTRDGGPTVSTEAEELHRIVSASVRDMLDAFRIQAQAGPVTDKALEEIVFRAAHGVMESCDIGLLEDSWRGGV
jgi:hypothetical protein